MKIAILMTAYLAAALLQPAGSAGAVDISEEYTVRASQVRPTDVVIVPDKDYGPAPFIIAGGAFAVITAAGVGVYRSRKGGKLRRNSKNNKINRNL